jgi:putative spermidine/putrescine transport system permease protein
VATVSATNPVSAAPRRAWTSILGNRPALLLIAPLLVLLAIFVLYPLVKLGIDSLTTGNGIDNYAAVFESAAGRRALITTVLGSLLVAVLSVGIGGICAWYIRSTKSSVAKIVLWLAVLTPFWMGTVTKNYAIVLLVAENGALNQLLDAVGLSGVNLLYTSTAVILGMVYTMVPYAAVSIYGALLTIDESLISAARSMGATRARIIRTIVLPLATPGIVASTALVFAISLGFYVTPVLLGGAQTPFMATFIQDRILTFFDYGVASAASVVLLVIAIVILALVVALVGRERLVRAIA